MITLVDPDSSSYPKTLDNRPDTRTGFMMYQGEWREIRDVHETRNGTQIELYSKSRWAERVFWDKVMPSLKLA